MTEKRPMNIELLKKLVRQFAPEYWETGLIGIDESRVHVEHDALAQVASPDMWTWSERGKKGGEKRCPPWRATVAVDGVVFLALFTDAEKAEALGETDETLDREPAQ